MCINLLPGSFQFSTQDCFSRTWEPSLKCNHLERLCGRAGAQRGACLVPCCTTTFCHEEKKKCPSLLWKADWPIQTALGVYLFPIPCQLLKVLQPFISGKLGVHVWSVFSPLLLAIVLEQNWLLSSYHVQCSFFPYQVQPGTYVYPGHLKNCLQEQKQSSKASKVAPDMGHIAELRRHYVTGGKRHPGN